MFSESASAERPLWRRVAGSTWFHLFAAFVLVGAFLSFVAKPYAIPSGSMEETLLVGDRVLVNRLAFVGAAAPTTGDVIVFDADESWGMNAQRNEGSLKKFARWVGEVSGFGPSGPHTLIKRVIGTPGQTVTCCSPEGDVVVDGAPLNEPYIFENFPFEPGTLDCSSQPVSGRCFDEVTVPEGSYLMLGDHRSRSSDSAALCRARPGAAESCWRWAHDDGVVGRASVILWPVSRWSGL
ncbi:signal peptidase I [Microbacterium sp. YY-01]|uniref:signal peptidase I n=1 Tax=Microbacterium sp. YY-01 TaxID=3421634 RepID=UPI003D163BFB